ncbi:MAG: ATP-binding cassette domain-containing protein [Bacilli bacterium]|nr:ATP-binding cassette domain-containing protein [Bacilli bacterium]
MSEKDIYQHARRLEKVADDKIAISVSHLTKDYGRGRGVFDVSFKVPYGTTFGYCGTNGAGKTTTLRHIMGFLKPEKGKITVKGLDAWENAEKIKQYIGYLPGEIAFPPVSNGSEFLEIQAEMLGLKDMSKAEKIINALQLDPTANLKRMSKGMKQKTALVAAFMHSPEIILLDEPTTGLDPLMREAFKNIIRAEQARGATIIMSNHMFDELEETCDYVAFIKDGHIVDIVDMKEIKERPIKDYVITFKNIKDFNAFKRDKIAKCLTFDQKTLTITCQVNKKDTNAFIKRLTKYHVALIKENLYNLERFFMENIAGGMQNGTTSN